MRRLMWNLNDESGGIGWRARPEAMGEIVARSERLADEYGHILISYLDPDGNYLEHPLLQRGLLWGIGRFAHARPEKGRIGRRFPASFPACRRSVSLWACRMGHRAAQVPIRGIRAGKTGGRRPDDSHIPRSVAERSAGRPLGRGRIEPDWRAANPVASVFAEVTPRQVALRAWGYALRATTPQNDPTSCHGGSELQGDHR